MKLILTHDVDGLGSAGEVAEIAAAATEATGKTVDRRTINVTTPIKSLGSYKATAKLHDDIVASLTIEVVEVVTKKKKKKK